MKIQPPLEFRHMLIFGNHLFQKLAYGEVICNAYLPNHKALNILNRVYQNHLLIATESAGFNHRHATQQILRTQKKSEQTQKQNKKTSHPPPFPSVRKSKHTAPKRPSVRAPSPGRSSCHTFLRPPLPLGRPSPLVPLSSTA